MTLVSRILGPLLLAGSMTTSLPVLAAPSANEYPTTRVQIDVQALDLPEYDEGLMVELLQAQIGESLHEGHGVPLSDDDPGASVIVAVRWIDAEKLHYAVAVTVQREGQSDGLTELECNGCSDADIGRAVTDRMPEIVAYLEPKSGTADEAPDVEPPATGNPPPSDPPNDRPSTRQPLGTLGKVGIPVLIVGAGTLAGGIAMAVRGAPSHAPRGELTEGLDLRPPGIGLAIGGGLVVATGIALIVVDRIRAKPKATAVAPVVSPDLAGLSMQARF